MVVEQEMADIYLPNAEDLSEFLPDLDCGECGFKSCIKFAEAVMEKKISPQKCPELSRELSDI